MWLCVLDGAQQDDMWPDSGAGQKGTGPWGWTLVCSRCGVGPNLAHQLAPHDSSGPWDQKY